ncbi:MAG: acyl-phosphate glycerol 3-phosphate acyltransferase [Gammaproteobacteria bacterium]|nr:MAG: acyl-phosphate glycerol 3-phosphate acyltransferase [Gammaproteobacteria bacterium]
MVHDCHQHQQITHLERTLDSLLAVTLWLTSYLVGSVSTAILVCRLLELPDPRAAGSQNPGATNVVRLAGKTAGALTFICDVAKGIIPVYLAQSVHPSGTVAALCGLFAFLGHCYPLYFDFRGGKGVATAFGVLLMFSWQSTLIVAGLWVAVFVATRTSSLASIISWAIAPIAIYGFASQNLNPVLILTLLIIYRHYPNLFLLAKGSENKFPEAKD